MTTVSITVIKRKIAEINKTQERQVMKIKIIATNWLIPSQCLSSELLNLPPSFIYWSWCHMIWNIPVVSWGQLSWLCSLPIFCVSPAWWGGVRNRKALDSVKHWSAITKTSLNYQHYGRQKSKTQPQKSHCEENYLYHSQNSPNSCPTGLINSATSNRVPEVLYFWNPKMNFLRRLQAV